MFINLNNIINVHGAQEVGSVMVTQQETSINPTKGCCKVDQYKMN